VIQAWCYRHDAAEPEVIDLEEVLDVSKVVERIDPDGGLVWIDCDDPQAPEVDQLLDALGVNEFAREDIAHADQRTKLAHYEDHFHVAVYDCVLHPDALRPREIDIVFAAGWLVTVHQDPEDGDPGAFPVSLVKRRFELQRAQHLRAEVGLLLWALLAMVVDRYFAVTEAVDDRLDDVEDAVLASDDRHQSDGAMRSMQLFSLGKALVRFRRAAIPLRDVTTEIARKEVPCISDLAIVHFQDLADHVLRVSDFVESQRDVITGLRDAELAVASNRLSRSQQKIAAWGAIFLIATLITGVLGMNFRGAPEVDWEIGFLVVAGLMVLFGLPVYIYFKRKDWI
jgi:magnesium transporter